MPGNPIGIIENPIDNCPDIPMVVNPWPNAERALRGMGLKNKEGLIKKIEDMPAKRVEPVTVPKEKALCKQVVIPENRIDLTKNIPRVWVEFNKLCFAGCNGTIIAYDPETKTHGLTKTRLGVFDWDNGDPNHPFLEEKVKKFGFATMARPGRPGQGNTGRYYFDNYRAKDKPWPAAFVYGIPTDTHVLAAVKNLRWPETGDEYELLGGFRGEPVELVKSETIPGLMVPANAEWVIEGEFISQDYRTPEYSEDVVSGFVWGEALWPVFKVKCITHRKNPLWTATTFSSLGYDHQGAHTGLLVGVNAGVISMLRKMGHKIKDVVPLAAQWVMVIQLEVDGRDKPHPGYGEEIGRLVGNKYTIVVGPDINPYDPEEVLWAVGMRAGRGQWHDYPPNPQGCRQIRAMAFSPTWDIVLGSKSLTLPFRYQKDSILSHQGRNPQHGKMRPLSG